ncbi:MAG: ABC transporter permease [Phycisphaerales bacterium]|nr:ABC transporter permease [Phycisphaerales bacterium]
MKMAQTKALFVDAYRELNAKKMFWLVLLLSGLVVAAFAMVTINDRGIQVLFWTLDMPVFSTKTMSVELFYKQLFLAWGIGFWLTWIAAILALVSTSGMIPDFVSGGAIELTLSKPIGRARLFLTKYVTGLVFVALQVAVFSFACILVFGLRAGYWEPRILLAIPIVVLFYSYIYCVCALVGLLSRSALTALLVTILFWFVVFLFNAADAALLQFQKQSEAETRQSETRIAAIDVQIDALKARLEKETTDEGRDAMQGRIDRRITERDTEAEKAAGSRGTAGTISKWHRGVYIAKTVLPKTGETTGLLSRYLVSEEEEASRAEAHADEGSSGGGAKVTIEAGESDSGITGDRTPPRQGDTEAEAAKALQAEFRGRSLFWIIGTSVIFEFVVLGAATLIFVRRDF